jgi:hypothetical protein
MSPVRISNSTQRSASRRGYALLLVVVFITIFLGMLGIAWRQVAAMLRIEKAVELRREGDEGSVRVLAQAMQVMENYLCWTGSTAKINISGTLYPATGSSFTCKKYFNASSDTTSQNWQYYLITFTKVSEDGSLTPPQSQWTVSVTLSTVAGVTGYPELPDMTAP